MFLAFKEIIHEKIRYALIIAIIALISYLIFILTSLSQGLANENTSAIKTWQINSIVLNKNANLSLQQSMLTNQQVLSLKQNGNDALIGQSGIVVKHKDNKSISAVFIGIKKSQFIYKNMKIVKGHKFNKPNQVVLDSSFINSGYKLGQCIQINSGKSKFKIVGFVNDAKINIAPIVYGNLSNWRTISNLNSNLSANALVSRNVTYKINKNNSKELKSYSVNQFISKLPGYAAQNITFEFMICFLMVISFIVISIFLYIVTIQKIPNYSVLRAQGVPAKMLIMTTIAQSFILVISGIISGAIFTWITYLLIPSQVPMSFNVPILLLVGFGLILMSMLGSLLPVREILKIDPVKAIN